MRDVTLAPTVDYVGPFESHVVVVDGRAVPFLSARPINGGKISLTLDHRFGLDIPVAEAEAFIPFLANAMAIAMGFACFPHGEDEPVKRPEFPRISSLD